MESKSKPIKQEPKRMETVKLAPTREWLVAWLDAHFSHNDYWQLSRKWKHKHFEDVANEILEMLYLYTYGANGFGKREEEVNDEISTE